MPRTRHIALMVAGVGLLTASFLGGGVILGEKEATSATTRLEPNQPLVENSPLLLSLAEIAVGTDKQAVEEEETQEAEEETTQEELQEEPTEPVLNKPQAPPSTDEESVPEIEVPPVIVEPGVDYEDDGGVLEEPPLPDNSPSVSSISPEDGVKGVPADKGITIIFSEPMDKLSTESAISISTGTPGLFVWASNYASVVFVPGSPLPYGEVVKVEVSTDAQSALGLPMADTYSSSFMVVQQSVVKLISRADLDGEVWTYGIAPAHSTGQLIYVGPHSRGFLSFDLEGLPEDLVEIQEAKLSVNQVSTGALAYKDLGNLVVRSWHYGTLDEKDYGGEIVCSICGNPEIAISTDASLGWKTADVTALMRFDWEQRGDRGYLSQYRLRFAKDGGDTSNFNGFGYDVAIDSGEENVAYIPLPETRPMLEITYTHP